MSVYHTHGIMLGDSRKICMSTSGDIILAPQVYELRGFGMSFADFINILTRASDGCHKTAYTISGYTTDMFGNVTYNEEKTYYANGFYYDGGVAFPPPIYRTWSDFIDKSYNHDAGIIGGGMWFDGILDEKITWGGIGIWNSEDSEYREQIRKYPKITGTEPLKAIGGVELYKTGAWGYKYLNDELITLSGACKIDDYGRLLVFGSSAVIKINLNMYIVSTIISEILSDWNNVTYIWDRDQSSWPEPPLLYPSGFPVVKNRVYQQNFVSVNKDAHEIKVEYKIVFPEFPKILVFETYNGETPTYSHFDYEDGIVSPPYCSYSMPVMQKVKTFNGDTVYNFSIYLSSYINIFNIFTLRPFHQ